MGWRDSVTDNLLYKFPRPRQIDNKKHGGVEGYRQITGSSACFQNEQANFDKLRYAAPPDCFALQNSGGSDPDQLS